MRILQLLLACFAILFAGVCTFGFLASFEAAPYALAWKVGYAALAVASLACSAALALTALRGPRRLADEPGGGVAH